MQWPFEFIESSCCLIKLHVCVLISSVLVPDASAFLVIFRFLIAAGSMSINEQVAAALHRVLGKSGTVQWMSRGIQMNKCIAQCLLSKRENAFISWWYGDSPQLHTRARVLQSAFTLHYAAGDLSPRARVRCYIIIIIRHAPGAFSLSFCRRDACTFVRQRAQMLSPPAAHLCAQIAAISAGFRRFLYHFATQPAICCLQNWRIYIMFSIGSGDRICAAIARV